MSDENFQNGNATSANSEHVRVRYRFGETEMEVEGPPDYVNEHARLFLAKMTENQVAYAKEVLMIEAGEKDTPALDESADVPNHREPVSEPMDLISFFRKKQPKNQTQEVLIITYFYQHYKSFEHMSLEDYQEAYSVLRRLAVETPGNMKSTVRNVVDRTGYLFNPVRGKFALTLPGEELVESLPESNKES